MGHCRMADLGLPPRRVPQFALMGIAAFGASILFFGEAGVSDPFGHRLGRVRFHRGRPGQCDPT